MDLITHLQGVIQSLGPIGVFWASILEEVVVAIPSSFVQMTAGFFLLGDTPFGWPGVIALITKVAIPAALGVLVGSLPVYFLAYYGGEIAIRRYGKWFMLKWEYIERAKRQLEKKRREFWLVSFFRFLPAMPSVVITGFAGIIKMPLGQYALSTLLATFARVIVIGSIGWLTRGLYGSFAETIDLSEKIGLLVVVAAIGFGIFWYAKKSKSRKNKSV